MTLAARVAVASSRRIAVLSTGLLVGGLVVAFATVATRWPQAIPWHVAAAIALLLFASRRTSRAARLRVRVAIVVSQRGEIAVFRDDESGDEETWRVGDSTMIWPGFSMLAFTKDDDEFPQGARGARDSRSMSLPVFDAELDAADRRSLARVLLWSLRGGEGLRSTRGRGDGSA